MLAFKFIILQLKLHYQIHANLLLKRMKFDIIQTFFAHVFVEDCHKFYIFLKPVDYMLITIQIMQIIWLTIKKLRVKHYAASKYIVNLDKSDSSGRRFCPIYREIRLIEFHN